MVAVPWWIDDAADALSHRFGEARYSLGAAPILQFERASNASPFIMAHINRERFVLHSWTKDGRAISRPSRDGAFGPPDPRHPLRRLNNDLTCLMLLGIAGFAFGYGALLIFR